MKLFDGTDPTISHIYRRLGQLHVLANKKKSLVLSPSPLPLNLPDGPFQAISADQIANFMEVAFWTSLRVNEGRPVRFSASLEEAMTPKVKLATVPFAVPIPFDEAQVAKLAPALPRGDCFVVSAAGGTLTIRGFAPLHETEWHSVVARVLETGIVRVKVGWLNPLAILDGRNNSILEGMARSNLVYYLDSVFEKRTGKGSSAMSLEGMMLVELLQAIADDGHGGTVLIVPDETGPWRNALHSRIDSTSPAQSLTIRSKRIRAQMTTMIGSVTYR